MLVYHPGTGRCRWIASIIAMKFYPLTGEKMKEIEDSIAETQQKNAVKA